ncbi:MAG: hypothetical protein E6J09_09805 [Chloroflexi bacterium]|nr:MAG: hypothetical protein E6J09_09805 [Chloroflexota bacterium]
MASGSHSRGGPSRRAATARRGRRNTRTCRDPRPRRRGCGCSRIRCGRGRLRQPERRGKGSRVTTQPRRR